jgi:plasmid stabilization system protein ParE
MNIIWYPLALERVRIIVRYIARDKPTAAYKYVDSPLSVSRQPLSYQLGSQGWVRRLFGFVAKELVRVFQPAQFQPGWA